MNVRLQVRELTRQQNRLFSQMHNLGDKCRRVEACEDKTGCMLVDLEKWNAKISDLQHKVRELEAEKVRLWEH